MKRIMKYTALPTWLLTKLMQPHLPKTHPWHDRKFTLEMWAHGRTVDCKLFDLCFWLVPLLFVEIIWLHFFK